MSTCCKRTSLDLTCSQFTLGKSFNNSFFSCAWLISLDREQGRGSSQLTSKVILIVFFCFFSSCWNCLKFIRHVPLPASKCCRTKLFEIKQQHELSLCVCVCVRQKFSISGRYNKYQATFSTHSPPLPPLVIASGSIAAYVLWLCEYSALLFLPCLAKVSSQMPIQFVSP